MKQHILEPPQIYTYELQGGWTAIAGKTDRDNDILSIKLTHLQDWWFHVHGMPGSHVLLKSKANDQKPEPEIFKAAAAIAVYHSKARSGGVVPVSCTRARYVTKPRGSKPGMVTIRKERIIRVQPAIPDKKMNTD